jgi:hypothetical protein
MKFFKLIKSKYFLIPLVILILMLFIISYKSNPFEPFVEGVCTSATQKELQQNIMTTLNQPVVNSKNVIVDTNTILNSLNKTIDDGTYNDCEQTANLKKILADNITSPTNSITAIKSYYNTSK